MHFLNPLVVDGGLQRPPAFWIRRILFRLDVDEPERITYWLRWLANRPARNTRQDEDVARYAHALRDAPISAPAGITRLLTELAELLTEILSGPTTPQLWAVHVGVFWLVENRRLLADIEVDCQRLREDLNGIARMLHQLDQRERRQMERMPHSLQRERLPYFLRPLQDFPDTVDYKDRSVADLVSELIRDLDNGCPLSSSERPGPSARPSAQGWCPSTSVANSRPLLCADASSAPRSADGCLNGIGASGPLAGR
jgi:hypothetical protein